MITAFFISTGAAVLRFFAGLLPVATGLPAGFSDAIATLTTALNSMSYIVPVATLFIVVGIVVTFELALWGFQGSIWLWKRLTGR